MALMPRILVAFALGALASWWLVPQPAVEAPTSSHPSAGAAVIERFTGARPAPVVGIPPESATLPSSHPSAGQRRALARALDKLADAPSDTAALPGDEETTARLAAALRTHLRPQGDQP